MSLLNFISNLFSNTRREYPVKIVGERLCNNNAETTILYRISPKKEVFEIPLKELLEDAILIEKIHPYQAVKLGFMACGEIMFNYKDGEDRKMKYQEIVKKMND